MLFNNSFSSQPYQYINSVDPAAKYNPDGTLRANGTLNAIEGGVEKGGSMVPVWGQIVSAGTAASKAARSTNTGAGDVFGGLLAPHTQAFADWGKVSTDQGGGKKAADVFSGIDDFIDPIGAGIRSYIDGEKRRKEQASFNYNKQFDNQAGYLYGLDSNGLNTGTNVRHVYNQTTPNNSASAAAINGIAGMGGDLLKQFLSRPKSTDNNPIKTGAAGNGINFQNPYTTSQTPQTPPINIFPMSEGDYNYSPDKNYVGIGNPNDTTQLGGGQQINTPESTYSQFNLPSTSSIDTGTNNWGGIFSDTSNTPLNSGDVPYNTNLDFVSPTVDTSSVSDISSFHKGGTAVVQGGKGDDDIALVETGTGKDTGVRVEKGEMLVYSKENLDALKDAVARGDKDAAFAISLKQLKAKPNMEGGTQNHSGGGLATTKEYQEAKSEYDRIMDRWKKNGEVSYEDKDKLESYKNILEKGEPKSDDKISKLADPQLAAALRKAHWAGSGKDKDAIRTKIKNEFEKRGLEEGSFNYDGFNTPTYLDRSGKRHTIDDSFDYRSWEKGALAPTPNIATDMSKVAPASGAVLAPLNNQGVSDMAYGMKQQVVPPIVPQIQKVHSNTTTPTHPLADPNTTYNQQRLNELGFSGADGKLIGVDGLNGPNTLKAMNDIVNHKYDNGQNMAKVGPDGKLIIYDVNGNPATKESVQKASGLGGLNIDDIVNGTNRSTTSTATTGGKPSLTTNTPLPETKNKFDWTGALGYGVDAAKLALGAEGASTPLPSWQVPHQWTDYAAKMKYRSEQGLSPEDIAMYKDNADSTYMTNLENNKNLAGGNTGALLGADTSANLAHYRAGMGLASANANAHGANEAAYAPIAGQEINNSRTLYNDDYDRAMMSKTAGANLMNRSLDDLASKAQYDKSHGIGSDYADLVKLQKEKEASDINLNNNYMDFLQKNIAQRAGQ